MATAQMQQASHRAETQFSLRARQIHNFFPKTTNPESVEAWFSASEKFARKKSHIAPARNTNKKTTPGNQMRVGPQKHPFSAQESMYAETVLPAGF